MEKYQEIERSIITRFRKEIWSKFVKTASDYDLIKEDDKVMVCISGGKDSFLLAKDLIKVSGKSELPGKPNLYTVTNNFLDYFGLATIDDLPKIEKNDKNGEKELYSTIFKDN